MYEEHRQTDRQTERQRDIMSYTERHVYELTATVDDHVTRAPVRP